MPLKGYYNFQFVFVFANEMITMDTQCQISIHCYVVAIWKKIIILPTLEPLKGKIVIDINIVILSTLITCGGLIKKKFVKFVMQCFFWLKNINLTYIKDFPWKKGPNLLDFKTNNFKLPIFYDKFQEVTKNMKKSCFFPYFCTEFVTKFG